MTSLPLPAVDGLRCIMNIWVVAAHVTGVVSFFLFFAANPQTDKQQEFLSAGWPDLSNGLGYQVDIFFMLTGFLLTWSFLEKSSSSSSTSSAKSEKKNFVTEVLLQFVKRVFRLWPATMAALVLSWYLGDYRMNEWKFALSQLLYPLDRNNPVALVIGWSNQVDIVCSTILFAVCYLLDAFGLWSTLSCLILTIVSFLPKLVNFLTLTPRASYIKLKQSGFYPYFPMFMSPERTRFFETTLFAGQFDADETRLSAPYKAYIMQNDYLVFHQRITPFFVGLMLAYNLREELHRPSNKVLSWKGKVFHGLSFFLACLFASQPFLLAAFAPKPTLELIRSQHTSLEDPDPPIVPDFLVSCLNRSLYAAAFAYFLYRCLLPVNHPLHFRLLNKVWSHPVFQSISKYSYAIYCTHNRLIFEILLKYVPPRVFEHMSVRTHFVFGFVTTYVLSLLVGAVIYHGVEEPLTEYVFGPILRSLRRLMYPRDEKKKPSDFNFYGLLILSFLFSLFVSLFCFSYPSLLFPAILTNFNLFIKQIA